MVDLSKMSFGEILADGWKPWLSMVPRGDPNYWNVYIGEDREWNLWFKVKHG